MCLYTSRVGITLGGHVHGARGGGDRLVGLLVRERELLALRRREAGAAAWVQNGA